DLLFGELDLDLHRLHRRTLRASRPLVWCAERRQAEPPQARERNDGQPTGRKPRAVCRNRNDFRRCRRPHVGRFPRCLAKLTMEDYGGLSSSESRRSSDQQLARLGSPQAQASFDGHTVLASTTMKPTPRIVWMCTVAPASARCRRRRKVSTSIACE